MFAAFQMAEGYSEHCFWCLWVKTKHTAECPVRALSANATPAAVAALDRAMEENVKLRALFDRFGQYLDHTSQCGLRGGSSGRCTCGLMDFVKQVAELGA